MRTDTTLSSSNFAVSSEPDWWKAVQTTVAEIGRLGILATVEQATEELWDIHMDTHAKGAFLRSKQEMK